MYFDVLPKNATSLDLNLILVCNVSIGRCGRRPSSEPLTLRVIVFISPKARVSLNGSRRLVFRQHTYN
jgi:hypothetical protein